MIIELLLLLVVVIDLAVIDELQLRATHFARHRGTVWYVGSVAHNDWWYIHRNRSVY